MTKGQFRAGVGRATITPPLTVPHAGWGAQTHVYAEGIETDLWATVLLLDDGTERAAIVDLDLVVINQQETEAIAAAVAGVVGIRPAQVRVSVTHNHTGPPPSRWDWLDGTDALRRYYESLPEFSAGAARIALAGLRPARVGVGTGESRVAVNRRETAPDGRTVAGVNLAGVIDPQVFVLRIDTTEREPLAVLVGYTMHPTTAGPTFRRITADWPGHMKRTVERLTGATCLFAQGATGNIGPGVDSYTDDASAIRRLGTLVGYEAARVHLDMRVPAVQPVHERVWESGAPLGKWTTRPIAVPEPIVRSRVATLRLPLRPQPPVPEAAAHLVAVQRKLRELVDRGAPAAEIEAATFVTKRANMTVTRARTYGGRSEDAVELHLLRIGPAVLAAISCEPFAEIALAIKARSPFPHTWFGGYVGGWGGYIPIADEYPRGGYEVETSPFTPEAAARVVDGTLAALQEFHKATEGSEATKR
ncbi:MAG TPA: neutral/alkaline non-lysosomal ceramidase N-terminal domain-containing protein [bacterium]|nr:neutral/alkaline non-lysosomal ceramidase N-terminal domain-containing protein [bacterium]